MNYTSQITRAEGACLGAVLHEPMPVAGYFSYVGSMSANSHTNRDRAIIAAVPLAVGDRIIDSAGDSGVVVHVGPTGLLARVLYDGTDAPVARFTQHLTRG